MLRQDSAERFFFGIGQEWKTSIRFCSHANQSRWVLKGTSITNIYKLRICDTPSRATSMFTFIFGG